MSQYTYTPEAQQLREEFARLMAIPSTPDEIMLAGGPMTDDEIISRWLRGNSNIEFSPEEWAEIAPRVLRDGREVLEGNLARAPRRAELDAIYARNVRNSRRWEWIQSAAILFAIGSN